MSTAENHKLKNIIYCLIAMIILLAFSLHRCRQPDGEKQNQIIELQNEIIELQKLKQDLKKMVQKCKEQNAIQ